MFYSTLILSISILKTALAHAIQFSLYVLLNLVLSDEAHYVFGSMFFYPVVSLTLLFLTTQVVPVGTVDKCKEFCLRHARKLKHYVTRHRKLLLPVRLLAGVAYAYFL